LQALERLKPDIILVEGPPEGDALLPLIQHGEMEPPVALLVYASENPSQAVFYPFAEFSPEWQALRYGLKHKIPTRYFDLPLAHRFAAESKAKDQPPSDESDPDPVGTRGSLPLQPPQANVQPDPLTALAHAAGYNDFERWWNHLVEERRGSDVFEAVLEAITALREEDIIPAERTEQLREAAMRQNIRQAQKAGHQHIAVVCGAWHGPALVNLEAFTQTDTELLISLPRTKTSATWIPWTFSRLSRYSGYGAGIESPGWYQHLWQNREQISIRWMARVAGLLREQDLEASSAQVIEGVRLADTLAAMRGRALAGLDELNEASEALFSHGNPRVLALIAEKLIVGEGLGQVPPETPAAPLQQDLAKEIKHLRLKQDAAVRDLELDLRGETDLQRSHLFHRLNLLGVPWGKPAYTSGKGTFKEGWQVKWEPEYAVALIEAGRFGATMQDAATGKIFEAIAVADLPTLTGLLDNVLLADLPKATAALMHCIESKAAETADIPLLMGTLPGLARVLRYGNVRKTDTQTVAQVVDGLLTRICVGLPNACSSLSDEAAEAMFKHVLEVQASVSTLQNPEQTALWLSTLHKLSGQNNLHGLIAGRCIRILMDASVGTTGGSSYEDRPSKEISQEPEDSDNLPTDATAARTTSRLSLQIDSAEAARRLGLALSDPDPAKASAWIEGFLKGSGLILTHDDGLFGVLDRWLAGLSEEAFVRVVPLLRRTFSTFEAPERRSIGERARNVKAGGALVKADAVIDHERGAKVLPLLGQLLGLKEKHEA
jgi:hypothetical protein